MPRSALCAFTAPVEQASVHAHRQAHRLGAAGDGGNVPRIGYEWLRPRLAWTSGLTLRQAIKPLSAQQRDALLSAR